VAERRDDIELMQQFDGELPDAELSALTDDERVKLEALAEMSELVRGHLELATDDAEGRFDGMWDAIERRISANGAAAEPRAIPRPPPAADEDGLFTRIGRWLDRYRGHVLTGAVCAGAAAALVIALRPPRTVTRTEIVKVPAQVEPAQTFASQPAVVEDLDVSDGSGTVLTIPGEEGENPTTVIWVTRDDMEGPI